jgi:hypothetical protein
MTCRGLAEHRREMTAGRPVLVMAPAPSAAAPHRRIRADGDAVGPQHVADVEDQGEDLVVAVLALLVPGPLLGLHGHPVLGEHPLGKAAMNGQARDPLPANLAANVFPFRRLAYTATGYQKSGLIPVRRRSAVFSEALLPPFAENVSVIWPSLSAGD